MNAPATALTVGMVAGEASGDLLAGMLLGAMRQRWPEIAIVGIGGPRMVSHGMQAWWPHHLLSVHGFGWDVLLRYREIAGVRRQLRSRLLEKKPTLFIGVDAPDFNLQLEEELKNIGIKTIHFVCPSVWAWRAHRIEKLKRSANHVLCIFPFEPELLATHGIAATYVGHPLAHVIPMQADRAAARQALGFSDNDDLVALLPGSRVSEVKHLAMCFLDAAVHMLSNKPHLQFILPAAPGMQATLEAAVLKRGLAGKVRVIAGQSHTALAACDVSLIASGTATLEAALFKRPMVIAYRMGALSWQLMKRKRLQPWVGLPNILCKEFVVPEFLQEAATPQALADSVLEWLDAKHHAPNKLRTLENRFIDLHLLLSRDTPQLALAAIEKVLHG
jgi:lipid-A-disaccharide synthase